MASHPTLSNKPAFQDYIFCKVLPQSNHNVKTFVSAGGYTTMFGLFKKTPELEKLQKQYKKVLEESYVLSHSNRAASDQKAVEADEILKKIELLKS
jgi:hypothetical protein